MNLRLRKGKQPPRKKEPQIVSVEGGGYVPITPGGTACMWLEAATEEQAWKNLLIDAAHMPYAGKAGFIDRGYTVERFT